MCFTKLLDTSYCKRKMKFSLSLNHNLNNYSVILIGDSPRSIFINNFISIK